MSQSLEAAIVLPTILILMAGSLAKEIPILKEIHREAVEGVELAEQNCHPKTLYELKDSGSKPALEANPQKMIEGLRLAEHMLTLDKRRKREENIIPENPFPTMPDALPPGKENIPWIEDPSSNPALPPGNP